MSMPIAATAELDLLDMAMLLSSPHRSVTPGRVGARPDHSITDLQPEKTMQRRSRNDVEYGGEA
jgi:hypothetical protein